MTFGQPLIALWRISSLANFSQVWSSAIPDFPYGQTFRSALIYLKFRCESSPLDVHRGFPRHQGPKRLELYHMWSTQRSRMKTSLKIDQQNDLWTCPTFIPFVKNRIHLRLTRLVIFSNMYILLLGSLVFLLSLPCFKNFKRIPYTWHIFLLALSFDIFICEN